MQTVKLNDNPHQPKPLMRCGHSANATNEDGAPVCVICIGLTPDASEMAPTPNLVGRTARCSYGDHARKPSSTDLAFFEYLPDQPDDRYYCGCHGWD